MNHCSTTKTCKVTIIGEKLKSNQPIPGFSYSKSINNSSISRFDDFRVFEHWTVFKIWEYKLEFNKVLNQKRLKPFASVSEIGWKHDLLALRHFFSSDSNPLHPYCSEQTRLREETQDPRHSVHCDQVARITVYFGFSYGEGFIIYRILET